MLNISTNSIQGRLDAERYSTLKSVEGKKTGKVLIRIFKWAIFLTFVALLLPWTQNVRSGGVVSTLLPDQRPQLIQSIIAGRIDKWYVREGQFVEKGDTIALISEIKDAYFDSQLLDRTREQLDLKKQTVDAYGQKEEAQESQLGAMADQVGLQTEQARIELQQARLRVENDSIGYIAAKINYETAKYQFERMDTLFRQGLKSMVDLEGRNLQMQQAKAREVEAKNKWMNSKNDLISLQLEISSIQTKFRNEYSKVLSEKLTTASSRYDAASTVNKLENQLSNYVIRQGFYYIKAPQDGYVTEMFVMGIGETVKEGQQIASIMPADYQLAVEIFVNPVDLPLMNIGQHVRLQFDGWPSIVFSGWPNVSYGTFGGEIYAVDQFISPNGKYRILVKPSEDSEPWPNALRFGGGANAMILLKDVPLWYELWRKINAFPPDYYKPQNAQGNDQKK